MNTSNTMRLWVARGLTLLLAAACAEPGAVDGTDRAADAPATAGAGTAQQQEDGAGFEAVAEGEYEVVRADGSIDALTISPGMIWSMVFADGEAAGGTIFMQDGKTCFVTEGVAGHQCFTGTAPAEDGSIESTAEDGEVMTVRPRAS